MALPRAKLGVSLFRHPCRKPLSPGKAVYAWLALRPAKPRCIHCPASVPGGEYGDWRPCDLPWGYAQSKDALVACQKFCTMQNQQSKQR